MQEKKQPELAYYYELLIKANPLHQELIYLVFLKLTLYHQL